MNKSIDINFKVGVSQWILAQPLCYPLLVSCVCFLAIGWLFGVSGLVIASLICGLITGIVVLTGIESKGVTLLSLIRSFLDYQLSKKILLKKDIHQKTQRVHNNCVVTKNYLYNQAKISSQEFSDIVDKDLFEKDLESLVNIATKDNLTYTIKTELTKMQKQDIKEYLEHIRRDTPERLNGAYLAFAQDLNKLVECGEFNQVKSEINLALPADRAENLNLQTKTLNNELQLLKNKTNHGRISIKQNKLKLS